MAEITFSIARKKATPLVQAVFSLVLGLLGIGLCRLFKLEPGAEYLASFIIVIFYCIMNIVISLANESFLRYTMPSIYLYIALVALLLLVSKQSSGLSIWTETEFQTMLTGTSIFYFMASIMVRGARLIYEAAESGL